ncbi:MAG: hypothetical protein CW338_02130 [Clostridiales bacterium]|nr:hypothetical protein [Clostridiales bacterium]
MNPVSETLASILTAVLALAGTLCGSFLAHRKSTALLTYRLEQLEKKVDKHNNLVERVYRLESAVEEKKR